MLPTCVLLLSSCRDVGVRLLCFFLDRGWPASARMVLITVLKHAAPVASFPAVVAAVAASYGEGLGILHRAVRSGQISMVTEVLGWAVQQRTHLAWDGKGPNGLTPLHLLALSGSKSAIRVGSPGEVAAMQPSLATMVLNASPGELMFICSAAPLLLRACKHVHAME